MQLNTAYLQNKPSLTSAAISTLLKTGVRICVPLITMPYVYPRLGPEHVGDVNWSMGLINLLVLLTSLGLYPYCIKKIGEFEKDVAKINELINQVAVIRFWMVGLLTLGIAGACFVTGLSNPRILFLGLLTPILVGETLGSDWLYVGLQQQYVVIKRFAVGQVVFVVLVFTVFSRHSTPLVYILIYAGTNGAVLFVNYITIHSRFSIPLGKFRESLKLVTFGLVTYAITVIMSFYGKIDLVVLGLMLGKKEFGIISADFRIIMLFTVAITSLAMVFLPKASNISGKSQEAFTAFVRQIFHVKLFISAASVILVAVNAEFVILRFFGPAFLPGRAFLFFSSPLIVFFVVNNFLTWNILYVKLSQTKTMLYNLPGIALFLVLVFVLKPQDYRTVLSILFAGNLVSTLILLQRCHAIQALPLDRNVLKILVVSAASFAFYFYFEKHYSIHWVFQNILVLGLFGLGSVALREKGAQTILRKMPWKKAPAHTPGAGA